MNELNRLKKIVAKLRGPGGCPWDQQQTMASITPHIIEEAYELIDSIQTNNISDIKEELGDVLLHVIMIAQMAEEKNKFSLEDIANQASTKMIRK
jgi:Protein containing tetrapyrrole methyltransferase domain and MazG-like (predicted pyrophosphatase) domain